MTRRTTRLTSAFVAAIVIAAQANAHHSFRSQYDADKPLTLTGVVTKVEWMNPHVYFYIDVEDEAGAATSWGFEMGPPHSLQRRGWKRNAVPRRSAESSDQNRLIGPVGPSAGTRSPGAAPG